VRVSLTRLAAYRSVRKQGAIVAADDSNLSVPLLRPIGSGWLVALTTVCRLVAR
jgi:hypothetical protein